MFADFAYPLTGLVSIISLIIASIAHMRVGRARAKFNVKLPEVSGPEEFNRIRRVAENTTENIMIFLPALWLFALSVNDLYAAAIGIFFPLGRILFARGYYEAVEKRSRGFMISWLSQVVLLLGSLIALSVIAWTKYL